MKIIFLLITTVILATVWSRTAEEWRTRTIYQIVTDRFGRTGDDTPICANLSDYCGGTFKGIQNNLDYIQGLGVNAIWISPVVKNAPGGYHGYWPINMYEINPEFGTSQDLTELIDACHARDIWVMVDVVPNHVAPVPNDNGTNHDFSGIYPFNDKKYYHWPIYACKYIDDFHPYNQTALEHCWLLQLPDLNHEDEFVSQTLIEWVKDFTQTYKIDGLRIDAVRHVPKWFWAKFTEAAGVFTIGEVFNHDVEYCSRYQKVMSSLLNFPLHGMLDKIFLEGDKMSSMTDYYAESIKDWDDLTVLGNFVVNQDFPRFLHDHDLATFKAYYAFSLSSVGMPIVYYGDEQSFTGGIDPENRETLWGKMNPDSEMYQYLKKIITFKNKSQYHNYAQIERLVEDEFYAFSRGDNFFAFTNSDQEQTRTIISHPYAEGAYLCSIFNEKQCVQVKNGEFQITILNKEVQILAPQQPSESEESGATAWKNLKQIWSSVLTADAAKHNSLHQSNIGR